MQKWEGGNYLEFLVFQLDLVFLSNLFRAGQVGHEVLVSTLPSGLHKDRKTCTDYLRTYRSSGPLFAWNIVVIPGSFFPRFKLDFYIFKKKNTALIPGGPCGPGGPERPVLPRPGGPGGPWSLALNSARLSIQQ